MFVSNWVHLMKKNEEQNKERRNKKESKKTQK